MNIGYHAVSKIRNTAKLLLNRTLSDRAYSIVNYNYIRVKHRRLPRLPDIHNPRTFNEKIMHLKLFNRYPDAHVYADKYAVRQFVADRIGPDYLIPLIGAFDDPERINFDELPSCFVAKPNHASGLVLLCDKEKGIDEEKLRDTFRKWLSLDYYKLGREYQYRDIPRKIVIEKLMSDKKTEEGLSDYKFFCFNGEPRFVQVDMDRFRSHRRNFYDLNWERLPFGLMYPQRKPDANKPESLQKMCMAAKILSEGFLFVRIDFYDVDGQVYFGEITFHPEGGTGVFYPENHDEVVGSYLKLEK